MRFVFSYQQWFCRHSLMTEFTAEVFKQGFERCSGVALCKRCEKGFMVYVPANELEKEEARKRSWKD